MSHKLTFLYNAVSDVQATIRATDVKLGFLFVIVFAPIAASSVIAQFLSGNLEGYCLVKAAAFVIGLLWALSVVALFAAVGAVSPPASHVKGAPKTGIYHGAGFFTLGLIDVFFNFPIKSKYSIAEVHSIVPSEEQGLESELVYELLKVSYIRDVKIYRFMFSLRCTFLWVALATLLMIYSYHGGLINVK